MPERASEEAMQRHVDGQERVIPLSKCWAITGMGRSEIEPRFWGRSEYECRLMQGVIPFHQDTERQIRFKDLSTSLSMAN
jgi:hypothetical protein